LAEGTSPYIVSVPTTNKAKEIAETKRIYYTEKGKEIETKNPIASRVLGGAIPIGFMVKAGLRAYNHETVSLSDTYYESMGLLGEKLQTGKLGVPQKAYRSIIYGAGETVGGVVTSTYLMGAGAGAITLKLAPGITALATKIPTGLNFLGKIVLSRPVMYGAIIVPTGYETYKAYKSGDTERMITVPLTAGLGLMGFEAGFRYATTPRVTQSLEVGKFIQTENKVTLTDARLLTKVQYPLQKPTYYLSDIKDITKVVGKQKGWTITQSVQTVKGETNLIGHSTSMARPIKKGISFSVGGGEFFTKEGTKYAVAGYGAVKSEQGLVKGVGFIFDKNGKIGDYAVILKDARTIASKELISSPLGKKAQAGLTLLQETETTTVNPSRLLSETTEMGYAIQRIGLGAGAEKLAILQTVPHPKAILYPLTALAMKEKTAEKERVQSVSRLKQDKLGATDVIFDTFTGTKQREWTDTLANQRTKVATQSMTKLATTTTTATKTDNVTKTIMPTKPTFITPTPNPPVFTGMIWSPNLKEKKKKPKKPMGKSTTKTLKSQPFVLPDIISIIQTEARTGKQATFLYPTPKVRKAFGRAVVRNPMVWSFPTAEMYKRRSKR
jgi:hypothetical protein